MRSFDPRAKCMVSPRCNSASSSSSSSCFIVRSKTSYSCNDTMRLLRLIAVFHCHNITYLYHIWFYVLSDILDVHDPLQQNPILLGWCAHDVRSYVFMFQNWLTRRVRDCEILHCVLSIVSIHMISFDWWNFCHAIKVVTPQQNVIWVRVRTYYSSSGRAKMNDSHQQRSSSNPLDIIITERKKTLSSNNHVASIQQ